MGGKLTYPDLVEECKIIYTELSFNARITRIAMWHLIGRTVIDNNLNPDKMRQFAVALGVDPYDLATAILLADRYYNLDDFLADKNKTISWLQVREYLDEETTP